MSFEQFLFYLFALILVFSAVMVVSSRNPVHAALFLVLAFFNAAGIWMLAEAEFLALTLVLVYVGAVMVLFLFVIMMLDVDMAVMRAHFVRNLPLGILVAGILLVEMVMVLGANHFGLERYAAPAHLGADASNIGTLGKLMFSNYLYAFELAAVILLVAIMAAISLTHRRRPASKQQDVSAQVQVKAKDRVRVIKMASEEKA